MVSNFDELETRAFSSSYGTLPLVMSGVNKGTTADGVDHDQNAAAEYVQHDLLCP